MWCGSGLYLKANYSFFLKTQIIIFHMQAVEKNNYVEVLESEPLTDAERQFIDLWVELFAAKILDNEEPRLETHTIKS